MHTEETGNGVGRRALGALLLFALAWRLIFFTGLQATDDDIYIAEAVRLLKGGYSFDYVFSFRSAEIVPLALFMRLFGISEGAAAIYNLILSVGNVALAFLIARHYLPLRGALVAGFLTAILPVNVLLATMAYSDVPQVTFCALSYYLFLRGRNPWILLASGACVGASYLARESAVFYLLFLGALFLIHKEDRKRLLWVAAGFAAVVAVECAFFGVWTGDPFFRHTVSAGIQRAAGDRFLPSREAVVRQLVWDNGSLLFNPLDPQIAHFGLFYLLFAVAAIVLLKTRRAGALKGLLLWWIIVALATNFFPVRLRPFMPALIAQARYFDCITIPAAIVTAAFLEELGPRLRGALLSATFGVAILCQVELKTWSDAQTAGARGAYERLMKEPAPRIVVTDPGTIKILRILDGYEGRIEPRLLGRGEPPAGAYYLVNGIQLAKYPDPEAFVRSVPPDARELYRYVPREIRRDRYRRFIISPGVIFGDGRASDLGLMLKKAK